MNYLVEMYDETGKKTYNFRQHTAESALSNLASLAQSRDTYPFVTATCYLNGKPVWELEFKQ